MLANRITGARRSFPAIALVLTGSLLAGCSGGDFFRTRDNMRSDDMHRWMGPEATGSIGMKASQFQLTDNERLLRDLAYPLVEAPLSRPAWRACGATTSRCPRHGGRTSSSTAPCTAAT